MPRIVVITLAILLLLTSCSSPTCSEKECTRVLFLGNSYTAVNDLPGTFAALAASGKHPVKVDSNAPGGWTLNDHLLSSDSLNKINSDKWTYVVIQEQSQIPSVKSMREQQMYPAARGLVAKIRAAGATPLFYETWGHQNGYPENGMPNYESMQFSIANGYNGIAGELNTRVAFVGSVWLMALREHPELVLWQADGSHPTEQGTYLAACVFYVTIFNESPEGLKYRGNLSKDEALLIQSIVAKILLK